MMKNPAKNTALPASVARPAGILRTSTNLRTSTLTATVLIFVVLGGAGCGASLGQLRMRAAFDYGCQENQLSVIKIDNRTNGVTGCGKKGTYVESCTPKPFRLECTWVLNSGGPASLELTNRAPVYGRYLSRLMPFLPTEKASRGPGYSLKRKTAPLDGALVSFWSPPMPVALLESPPAPTAIVAPSGERERL